MKTNRVTVSFRCCDYLLSEVKPDTALKLPIPDHWTQDPGNIGDSVMTLVQA